MNVKSRARDVGIEEVQNPDLSLCRKEVTACDSITSIASRVTSQRCDGLPDVSLCVVDAQQTQQRSIAPGSQLQRLLNCCHAAARVVNAGRTQTHDRRTRASTLFALILISARLHSFSARGRCCRDGDCAIVETKSTDVMLVRPHAC